MFKKGDRVRIIRQQTVRGYTFPSPKHVGASGVIEVWYPAGGFWPAQGYVVVGEERVGLWNDCIAFDQPLTPFEESIMAYIAKEKAELGIV